MNFRRSRSHEVPEINLIPLIDILLVVLIFLLLSSNLGQINILRIQLPHSQMRQTDSPKEAQPSIHLSLSATGKVTINQQQLASDDMAKLEDLLSRESGGRAANTLLVVHADAQATHQAVVHIMEAARAAGLARVSFATHRAQR
jgi:biopolymer transport protein ExbD